MSIETQNQVQLGTALQVFRSLGQLRSKVDTIIDTNSQAVLKVRRLGHYFWAHFAFTSLYFPQAPFDMIYFVPLLIGC